jgi:hypothetical protein
MRHKRRVAVQSIKKWRPLNNINFKSLKVIRHRLLRCPRVLLLKPESGLTKMSAKSQIIFITGYLVTPITMAALLVTIYKEPNQYLIILMLVLEVTINL